MLPADAPPALAEIAQRFAETSRGIVGFTMHRTFDVHAGFSSRHEDMVMDGVYEAGTIVKVRILTDSINGKPADATTQSEVENAWEHPKPGETFAPPFDSRHFSEYQYQAVNAGTIAFTSAVHDAAHGNGTFTYDAQGNVLSCVY